MEPKKNPKVDVHRYRSVIFNFSLLISLAIVITAFKWVVPKERIFNKPITLPPPEETYLVPVTNQDRTPEPVRPVETRIQTRQPDPTDFTVVPDNPQLEQANNPNIDQNVPVELIALGPIEIPIDTADILFEKVEKMPQPVGGYPAFYGLLQNKLRYPSRAVRNQTKGIVHVTFVVDEKGQLSNFAIQTGIGDGCDEEAIRVIKMSKWEPGKQRGRAVKVRMVQPINFSIQ